LRGEELGKRVNQEIKMFIRNWRVKSCSLGQTLPMPPSKRDSGLVKSWRKKENKQEKQVECS